MSIDAIINNVFEDDGDLILDLMAREVSGHRGQPQLKISCYTYVPTVGQQIWGGACNVIIEPGEGVTERKHYRRSGYVTLIEDFDLI